jgi:hypothetical protein
MTPDTRRLLRQVVASVIGEREDRRVQRSYDEHQMQAREVSYLCCRRWVFATKPEIGCLSCR